MKFKLGQKVRINIDAFDDENSDHVSVGLGGNMSAYHNKIAKITIVTNQIVSLDIDHGEYNWHVDWLEPVVEVPSSIPIETVKEIQKIIKDNRFRQQSPSFFDGRVYKDCENVYVQAVTEPDTLQKNKTIIKGMLYTSKLDEIERSKDFFHYVAGTLTLYGKRKIAIFKDVPILNMAAPETKDTGKPKSLYQIKSKSVDPDLLTAIKILIDNVKECDIDADIYFSLENIKSKRDLQENICEILRQSHRKYDENAKHLLKAAYILIESLP